MKTYNEWKELKEARWNIRESFLTDVQTLKNVYREHGEKGPAATVAAFVAAVGYNRAVSAVGSLVNRHAGDGRISRTVAAWAETLPEAWDREATEHFGAYINDIVHLAHFNQIAQEMKKTTPPEDDDKHPETISADTVQEAPETISTDAAQMEQEPAPDPVPESVTLAPEAFRAVIESAPRCGLLMDIQPGAVQYRTESGKTRCIYTDAVTVEYGGKMARIKYHNLGSKGQITLDSKHDCFPVAAVAAGDVSPSEALWKIYQKAEKLKNIVGVDRDYFRYTRKPAGRRKEEMKENMKEAAKLSDLAACIIKHAAEGIPTIISPLAADLAAMADAGKETNLGLTPAKHVEAVAAWLNETARACIDADRAVRESAADRPETISADTVQEKPETIPAKNTVPEAVQEDDEDTVILVETTIDLVNGGHSSRRIQFNTKTGKTETIPEKKPETSRKYAAYYEDFPYTPRIFPAKNKKEAEAEARRYCRAWNLPGLLRVEALTAEEAAKLEAEEAARWNIPKQEEAAQAPQEAPEAAQEDHATEPAAAAPQEVQEPAAEDPQEAPEAAQEDHTTEPAAAAPQEAPETVPEARPRRQAPEKPARGPGRPLDFIGQILSGNGWRIVFDTDLQRTRVILSEAVREKAAPVAEKAGFYYSVNTDSWHKKLSHKAHRAAEALAEKLREICA